jgi:alpha-ribazole phosphatase/probable phosphoglycerate mutase
MPENNCIRPNSSTIHLLRHGEVSGKKCFRGSTDTPLNQAGQQQMKQAVSQLESLHAIVSSPLSRCLSFASTFAASQKTPLEINDRFAEIKFGDWEQKTADEIELTDPGALLRFYQDPTFKPPGDSECQNDFLQRIIPAWQMLLSNYAGQNVLLITHAGVIRMLFSHILNIPIQQTFNIQIEHACLSGFNCFHSDTEKFIQLAYHLNTS